MLKKLRKKLLKQWNDMLRKNLLPDQFEPFKLAKGSFLIVNWLSVYFLHRFGSVLASKRINIHIPQEKTCNTCYYFYILDKSFYRIKER